MGSCFFSVGVEAIAVPPAVELFFGIRACFADRCVPEAGMGLRQVFLLRSQTNRADISGRNLFTGALWLLTDNSAGRVLRVSPSAK